MPIAEMSIVIGVFTIVAICVGTWLYSRLKLNRPYLGPDPRASRRRVTYETTKISSHGFPIGSLGGVDYPTEDDRDGKFGR